MRHLLDTSALCAHFLRQPGADKVAGLLADAPAELGVCVVSWFELRYALRQCGVSRSDLDRALGLYRELPMASCPVTDLVADRAAELRDATPGRLPLADALIAGCAATHGAVLVHRDAHMDAIPDRLVKKLRLPDESGGPVVMKEEKTAYGTRRSGRPRTSKNRSLRLTAGISG
jgi:predicted nucleic acid-binding protein